MKIEIQFSSGISLQDQIAYQVMKLIQDGQLRPGEQLPTTRALAVELGVNFNTVARAYRKLDRAGIISTQTGRGTFILDPEEPRDEKGKAERIEDLTRSYIQQATYLGFDLEEIQASLEKLAQRDLE